ncbi:NAD-binding protein [Multifurca ochricompacta]|uniref:NAD-binding protein n=1 Tax=Multifurca ochricompacta TaxID=376703 RepID=A0AAD4M9Q6_9AGAM|nr:NAD-binding protein [Multifurca ochricompacta]
MTEKRIGILSQLFPPKPTWNTVDVPDHTGKIVIITGGNGGIGKETARVLLSKGAKVYIATRSEEKSRKAIEELKKVTGKETIDFLKLDLADLASVKAAAEEYISKESELHTIYNNGGVMYTPMDQVTVQGYDMQFGTNVLGHFYFTTLLLPVLTATAKKVPAGTVRVVNVSSIGHNMGAPETIRWSTLATGNDALEARKKLGTSKLYGQSKMGNILFSNELARRYGSEGIVSISLHPGSINTDLSRHASGLVQRIGRLVTYEVSYGAINSLYAGTAPAAAELNGKFLTPWARLEKKLWEWCEEQVKDI